MADAAWAAAAKDKLEKEKERLEIEKNELDRQLYEGMPHEFRRFVYGYKIMYNSNPSLPLSVMGNPFKK